MKRTLLREAAGDQAGVGEVPGAVLLASRLRLAAEVEGVAGLELHAEGGLERLDPGVEQHLLGPGGEVLLVERSQQVELPPLGGGVEEAFRR